MDAINFEDFQFSDLFDLKEVQDLQDLFAEANGVASIITDTDGNPLTKPSNFSRFCELIRETELGLQNCLTSDATLGQKNITSSAIYPCMSCGLWDAGINITVGDKHVGNWLIGQIKNEKVNKEQLIDYACKLGVNRDEILKSYDKIPNMSIERFEKIVEMLSAFVKQITDKAYNNLQFKIKSEEKEAAYKLLKESENIYQDQLLKSRNLLQKALEIGIIGSWEFNIKEGKSLWTEESYKIFGVPEDKEVSFELFLSLIHPEDIDYVNEKWEKAVNGDIYDLEFRIIVNGITKWIREKADIEYNANGEAVFAIGFTQDITQYKSALEKLRKSEARFKRLSNLTREGILIHKNGVAINFNKSLEDMLGYKSSELAGKNIIPIVVPERYQKYIIGKIQSNAKDPYELEIIRKDGTILSVEFQGRQIIEHNGETLRVAAVRNITELKKTELQLAKSEKKFRYYFENAPEGIVLINSNRKIIDANPATCQITGYSRHELFKMSVVDFVQKEYLNDTLIYFKRLIKHGISRAEVGTITKNREKRYWSVDFSKLSSDSYIGFIKDITKRKEAEKELRRSNELNKSISESAADAIITIDQKGVVLTWNRAAEDIFGYTENEMIGNSLENVLPVGLIEGHKHGVEKLALGGKENLIGNTIELNAVRKNGSEFPLELSLSSWESENGICFTGIIRDISERKKAEKALVENESVLKAIFESTGDALVVVDNDNIITHMNKQFHEMWELPPEHATNIKGDVLYEFVLNSLQKPKKFKAKVERIFGTSQADYDVLYLKNGKILEQKTEPLVSGVTSIGRVWRFANITERFRSAQVEKVLHNITNEAIATKSLKRLMKHIQKELSAIMDTTNFYVALHEPETNTLTIPFFADEKDYFTSIPEGKTLTHYVFNTNQSILITKKEYNELIEQNLLEAHGTETKIWMGVPLRFDDKVIGVIAAQSYTNENAYDKSDLKIFEFIAGQISIAIHRKKAQEDTLKALEKAKESDRLKSAFLTNMSHEIRTPMNGIVGFIDLLQNANLSKEEQSKFFRLVNQSTTRLLGTINDIIDISKIEAGQSHLNYTSESLKNILTDQLNFFKPEVERKGLKIEFLKDLQDIWIETDRNKLESIISNLIKNALKFTEQGSILLDYNIGADKIEFIVKDSGIGIPPDKLKAIFNRFEQADLGITRGYEGSGLGLAISEAYSRMLGGNIWVESNNGEGSTFYFTIKLKQTKKEPVVVEEVPVVKKMEKNETLILVAEDDQTSFLLIKLILSKLKFNILHAYNGAEAVDLFKNNADIKLILMDMKMPEMDGIEATQKIREINTSVPIIAQSAYALEDDKEKAMDVGFNDYITKPINKENLISKIQSYL